MSDRISDSMSESISIGATVSVSVAVSVSVTVSATISVSERQYQYQWQHQREYQYQWQGVGGTVANEFALQGPICSSPATTPWPDGELENLRSPCYGLAIYKNQTFLLLANKILCPCFRLYLFVLALKHVS
ncbi:hypothetical protein PoB_000572100 [Plakobranchus ocellatus]|uniref:Uncharacterized protein n=1 Tax=Plakobranchus ocellatus TaxID=259542 RepID=A0AAV3Y7L4_9GAST|nr:hypothetical protein PoB_000572100 [Plakobranchus ocellatus]